MCKLIDAENLVGNARNLVEAARMASASLENDQGDALRAVLNIADEKLNAAIDLLEGYRAERHGTAEPSTVDGARTA